MAQKQDEFKVHANIFSQYVKAMLLAGMAARDVSYRMGETPSAIAFSEQLAKDAQALAEIVYKIVDAVPALFWRQELHIDIAIEMRESKDRLLSHVDLLKELPCNELQSLLRHQVDA